MNYPIDLGDSDDVVQQLLEAGALQNMCNVVEKDVGTQNIDIITHVGKKIGSVMKSVVHGFMQNDLPYTATNHTLATKSHKTQATMAPLPPQSKHSIVYFNPSPTKADYSIEF